MGLYLHTTITRIVEGVVKNYLHDFLYGELKNTPCALQLIPELKISQRHNATEISNCVFHQILKEQMVGFFFFINKIK